MLGKPLPLGISDGDVDGILSDGRFEGFFVAIGGAVLMITELGEADGRIDGDELVVGKIDALIEGLDDNDAKLGI